MFEIIDLLQGALADPWMLLFLAVWGVGYFVKEHTSLEVPWIVLPVGIILGVFLIELSLRGDPRRVMAWQMGFTMWLSRCWPGSRGSPQRRNRVMQMIPLKLI